MIESEYHLLYFDLLLFFFFIIVSLCLLADKWNSIQHQCPPPLQRSQLQTPHLLWPLRLTALWTLEARPAVRGWVIFKVITSYCWLDVLLYFWVDLGLDIKQKKVWIGFGTELTLAELFLYDGFSWLGLCFLDGGHSGPGLFLGGKLCFHNWCGGNFV